MVEGGPEQELLWNGWLIYIDKPQRHLHTRQEYGKCLEGEVQFLVVSKWLQGEEVEFLVVSRDKHTL